MTNLKGGYVILDLGILNLTIDSNDNLADNVQLTDKYNVGELKKILIEIIKIKKPILLNVNISDNVACNFIQCDIVDSVIVKGITFYLKNEVLYNEDGTVNIVEQYRINFNGDNLSYRKVIV